MRRIVLERGWVLVPVLIFLVGTLQLERFKSILLPALFAVVAIVLILIDLARGVRGVGNPDLGIGWRKLLAHFVWCVGFVAGIYLAGVVVGVGLVLALYLKWLGNRLRVVIGFGVGIALAIYAIGSASGLYMYHGLLFGQ